jgi:hypothetical protein
VVRVTAVTVTLEHEGLALLFRNRPSLSAELLAQVFDQTLPAFTVAKGEPADLTRVVPDQFFADAASVYYGEGDRPIFGVITEVQRDEDARKRKAWPVYVAVHRAQHDCPVWLLVVTPVRGVARWAAEPIELGHPDFVLKPLVLSPLTTPIITEPERARVVPELAVLSAMMHGTSERGAEVALAAYGGITAAFLGVDDDRLRVYQDLIDSSLNETARQALEAIMASGNYEYQGPFAKRYVAEGRAEGKAEGLRTAVTALCEVLGVAIGPARRARLEAMSVGELEALCEALKQTRRWPGAAAGASSTRPRSRGAGPEASAKKR